VRIAKSAWLGKISTITLPLCAPNFLSTVARASRSSASAASPHTAASLLAIRTRKSPERTEASLSTCPCRATRFQATTS
jgi:hypothetical protein